MMPLRSDFLVDFAFTEPASLPELCTSSYCVTVAFNGLVRWSAARASLLTDLCHRCPLAITPECSAAWLNSQLKVRHVDYLHHQERGTGRRSQEDLQAQEDRRQGANKGKRPRLEEDTLRFEAHQRPTMA